MGGAYTVALVGFAENESATFESFFRLAARRPPAYQVQDEVMDAQILIVNADNLQALHLVQYADLPGKVLAVGNSDGGTGWPLQRKPIKLVSVLAELDRLVGVAPKPASAPPPAAVRAGVTAHQPVPARQGADRGFAATEPYQSTPVPLSTPMVPAARPRRRSSDTEFPATRPMVRSTVASAAAPAPAAAPLAPTPMPASPRQQALNARAARPGAPRITAASEEHAACCPSS